MRSARTLSSQRASKYPGPGVIRRQPTGNSGTTVRKYAFQNNDRGVTGYAPTLLNELRLLGQLLHHPLSYKILDGRLLRRSLEIKSTEPL